jgi:hypothetical protein
MSTPENEVRVLPEVTMTEELAAAIQQAITAADVKSILMAEAEKQLATKTQLDADQAAAAQATAAKAAADQAAAEAVAKANQVFTRTEIIGGKEIPFSASSEAELDRLILNAFKVAYSIQQTPAPVEPVVDHAAEAAAAEAATLAKAELERKFRLGEISVADYMEQSGAVKDYLAKQGVSIETLQKVVETTTTQSWEQASEIFRNSPAGADWPGGVKNRQLLGDKLAALGLVDAEDKVAALAQAYAAMKATGAYFVNGDEPVVVTPQQIQADPVEAARVAKAAADAEAAAQAVRVAAAEKVRSMSSSLFGASSGTSGAPIVSPAVVEAKKIVPADADPQEIMRVWKEAQLAAGINPNEAFIAANRGKTI